MECGGQIGEGRAVGSHRSLPCRDEILARRHRAAKQLERLGRFVERSVGIPAVCLLDETNLIGPERRAMGLLGVLLVRAAEPDVGPDRDQARPIIGSSLLDRGRDRLDVVAVLDPDGVPAIRLEAGDDILRPGHRRRTVELDVVVVVEGHQLSQPEVTGEAGRLRGDALLEVAVRAEGVGPVVDDVVAVAVELGSETRFRDRHPDGVGEALAEGAGRRLDARRQAVLGVAGRLRAPLAE